jgi:hypothetical protein
MRPDFYQIYEATVPDNFTEKYIEDRINQLSYLHRIAKTLIRIYESRPIYDDSIQITALNGEYMVHPGVHRMIVGRLIEQPIKAFIVNRYGTSYEEILKTFPDAKPYNENMNALFVRKETPDDHGHFFYLNKNKEKSLFDNDCQRWALEDAYWMNTGADTIWEFAEKILLYYTDYGLKYKGIK